MEENINKDLINQIHQLLFFLEENRNIKVEIKSKSYNHYDKNGNIHSFITDRKIYLVSEDNKENVFNFEFNFIK
jgi:predicted nucleotide-binding protein (sugar kinase/HSP70/actin superfamily)